MTVCANRLAEPCGFFKGCGVCKCGQEAAQAGDPGADQLRDLIAAGVEQSAACHQLWPPTAATTPSPATPEETS